MAFLRCKPACIPGENEKMRLICEIMDYRKRFTFLEREDLDKNMFMSYVNLGNCSCCPVTAIQLAAWCSNRFAIQELFHHSKTYEIDDEHGNLLNRIKKDLNFSSQPRDIEYMYKRRGVSRFTWQFSKKLNAIEEFVTAPMLCLEETPLTILVTEDEDKPPLFKMRSAGRWLSEPAQLHKDVFECLRRGESKNSFITPQSRNNALSVLNVIRSTDTSPFDQIMGLGAPVPELKIYLGGNEHSQVFPKIPPSHPLIIFRVFSTENHVLHVSSIHTVFSEIDKPPKCVSQSFFMTRSALFRDSPEHTLMYLIHEVLEKHNAEISITSLSTDFDKPLKNDFSPGMKSLGLLCRKAIFHSVHVPYRVAVNCLPLPNHVKSQILL